MDQGNEPRAFLSIKNALFSERKSPDITIGAFVLYSVANFLLLGIRIFCRKCFRETIEVISLQPNLGQERVN